MAEVPLRVDSSHSLDPDQPYAALDLGSNSFHLIVAKDHEGRLQVVDKHKEMVRLAEGLRESNNLDHTTASRAIECLERFGQRVRHLPPHHVRVVGTNTLRKARNRDAFIEQAEQALGHRIEIISGREEARLIYLGVSHSLEDNHDSRFVVDIGGGSTELILGRQFQPRLMESLYIGCVSMSQRFFADGRLKAARFQAAIDAARLELAAVEQIFVAHGWDTAIGASGSILAVHDVIAEELGENEITREGLSHIRDRLIEAKTVDQMNLAAVGTERAPVFPGGVAILSAIFDALPVERMMVSSGALREGLLHDLLGRVHDEDIRDKTIQSLAKRYHVDLAHSSHVASSAKWLLSRVAVAWGLTDANFERLIAWAALLHEIGLDIAHSQYHKHGAYLLDNMDMPGFSRPAQHRLSMLVRSHRRKFPTGEFGEDAALVRLAVLLRLAVVLHRSRTEVDLAECSVSAEGNTITMQFSDEFLAAHRLTELDLNQEALYLQDSPVSLELPTAG